MVDLETTVINKGSWLIPDNEILVSCWIDIHGDRKTMRGGEHEQDRLLLDIEQADFIVAHNAKFELGWLHRCGLDLHDVLCYDTMLGEWVLLGNRAKGLQQLSLSASLERRGLQGKDDKISRLIKRGVDTRNIPGWALRDYCFVDVEQTHELFLKQRELLADMNLLHIQYSRCLLVPVLADLERQGIRLDNKLVQEEYTNTIRDYRLTFAELNELTGGGINWNSSKQVAEYVYDVLGFAELTKRGVVLRTEKGGRLTSAGSIESLVAVTELQKKFIELKLKLGKLNAALTKNLNFFKGVCDYYDSVLYGEYNQGTVGTHRLSSSGRKIQVDDSENNGKMKEVGAQLQNIPRNLKRAIIARAGYDYFEADFGQLEFRGAAELTRDPQAIADIMNDVDVHEVTKQKMAEYGEPRSRTDCKPVTFRPLYAGSSGTPAEQQYCKFFTEKYHVMYDVQTTWTQQVLNDRKEGCLVTTYGMRYYWPGTKMTRSGYITNTTQIFNAPIQGFATAEVAQVGTVYAWHRLRGTGVKLNMVTHDSIGGEKPKDFSEDWLREQIAIAFTADVFSYMNTCYKYEMVVPLAVGIKIGERCGAGVEYTGTVDPKAPSIIKWKTKE